MMPLFDAEQTPDQKRIALLERTMLQILQLVASPGFCRATMKTAGCGDELYFLKCGVKSDGKPKYFVLNPDGTPHLPNCRAKFTEEKKA